jgi:hypothetical protein
MLQLYFQQFHQYQQNEQLPQKIEKKKKKKDHDIMSLKMLFRHKNMAGLNRRMWNPNPIYLDIIIFFITKNLPVISAESE